MSCYLCLETFATLQTDGIGLYTTVGENLEIAKIIEKHFWLKPNKLSNDTTALCLPCWDALQCFHTFYVRIAAAHKYFESKVDAEALLIEDDPLPHETHLKTTVVNIDSNAVLLEENGVSYFDPEVKVEVHDLDLLPQAEVIEEDPTVSKRAVRSTRRKRNINDKSNDNTVGTVKSIKRESTPVAEDVKYESEPELAIATLMSIELKTDENTENIAETTTDTQKKKRGRPKKINEELAKTNVNNNEEQPNDVSKTNTTARALIRSIKSENDEDDFEQNADEFMDATKETDDSAQSTSADTDDDSDDSWHAPREKYAEIPKRVIVKPKKYRKRPKPAVPPKRLTREEIEKKHAQQAEYDKIIAKFFEKFVCPRCNLLVQNFGDMKAHFRVSHNDDVGYMSCCGRKFHLRKTLAEHVLVHWNPEQFKCATCAKIFQDSRALEVHVQSHACPNETKDKKTFQCDKCPKAFTTKAAFEYHSFSKHVPKAEFKFLCTECNKRLPTKRKLKDHMKYAHDPESAVICDKCGKQMRNQSSLKKHHEIEHSDKPRPVPVPMQCEICGTWLRHASGLKQHMKTIHEDTGGEHRCHICNKTSTNARALKRHIYHNHECERKFKCTMCEKAFKRPQDLREHTSTHTGEVLYTCPNCPMTFFSNANMYKHRQRLHRAEWEADRKKPRPPNIMGQAVSATAAMKMKQAVGATTAFFANKIVTNKTHRLQSQQNTTNSHIGIN